VVERLRNNDLPRANPAVFDPPPPMVDFQIGDPQRGDFLVRLIDYSGELLNPDLEHDRDSYVAKLKHCLLESDGFLVLAEVPRLQSDRASPFPDELNRLQQAFQSLRESKNDVLTTPVCVVLTKWDRQSDIDFDCPDKELEKLQQFLEHNQPFRDLCNSLSNALVHQEADLRAFWQESLGSDAARGTGSPPISKEDAFPATTANLEGGMPASAAAAVLGGKERGHPSFGLRWGNCWVFPASAFGRFQRAGDKEIRDQSAQPFGILEPLVWLANRRDQLDVAYLSQQWSHRWLSWLPFAWLVQRTRVLRRRAQSLQHRVARNSQAGKRLKDLQRALWFTLLWSAFTSFVVVLLLGDLALSWWNASEFENWKSEVLNPAVSEDKLLQARSYFDRYQQRPYTGFLMGPTARDARAQMAVVDQLLDEQLWLPVEQASAEGEKAELAEIYLRVLPNGPHACLL
ncbi:MAG: hypothetical protein N3G20_06255, partial [Verrucomicrobiae bacterium]|nr:hypothetical protein [Verrucomicrobiae bacterium]